MVYSLVNQKVIRSDYDAAWGSRIMIGKNKLYHTCYRTDSLVATDLHTGKRVYEVFTNRDIKLDSEQQVCDFVLVEMMNTEVIVQYPQGYYHHPKVKAILFRDAVSGAAICRTHYEEDRSHPQIAVSGNVITLVQSFKLPGSTDTKIVMDAYYWDPKETLSLLSSRWLQMPRRIYNGRLIVNPLSSQVFWVVRCIRIEMKLMKEAETPREEMVNGVVIKRMQLQWYSIPLTLPPFDGSLQSLEVLDERRLLLRGNKSIDLRVSICDFGPKW